MGLGIFLGALRRLSVSQSTLVKQKWPETLAKLADIGRGLGHSNLKTTSDYLEEQLGYTNAYARDLEDEFGI